MAVSVVFSFPAASATAVCTAQTTSGAASLNIDGPPLDKVATMSGVNRVILPGIERVATLTSTGNISGVNVTLTGKNLRGAAVTETRVGPNNNTVATTATFHELDSVSVDGAVATAMSVGTGSTGFTNWFIPDTFEDPFAVNISVAITATSSVTVENTPDDVQATASPTVFSHTSLVTITASAEGSYTAPVRGIRAKMNSSSGSGAFTTTIVQAG